MRWLSLASAIVGRGYEALELALEQPRELDARAIAVLRAHDLDSHRQTGAGEAARRDGGPAGGSAAGRDGGRQVGHAAVAGPEELVGGRHSAPVDEHGALVPLALVVVREGGRRGGGAERRAPAAENPAPPPAHGGAPLVGREPLAVRGHVG